MLQRVKSPPDVLASVVLDATSVTIRQNATSLPQVGAIFPGGPPLPFVSARGYESFAGVQRAVLRAVLRSAHGVDNATLARHEWRYQQLPTAARTDSFTGQLLAVQIPSMVVLAFAPLAIAVALPLIDDKTSGIRHALVLKGVRPSTYYAAHFSVFFAEGAVVAVLAASVIVGGGLVDLVALPALVVILLTWMLNVVSFGFLLSALTASTQVAVVLVIFCFYMLGGLSMLATSPVLSTVLAFFSPAAFGVALRVILAYRSLGAPFTLATLAVVDSTSGVSVGRMLIMLFVDTLLYALLGAYVYAVKPGATGTALPPLFFLKKAYWCPDRDRASRRRRRAASYAGDDNVSAPLIERSNLGDREGRVARDRARLLERRVKARTPGADGDSAQDAGDVDDEDVVSVTNLTKVFDATHRAVDSVDLEVGRGEVLGLLGHNGSGALQQQRQQHSSNSSSSNNR